MASYDLESLKCLAGENGLTRMKAAVYHSQHNIRIEEVPTPRIGDGEILVEMKACGICGSDLMDWYLKTRAPLVLGHEPTGIIAKKGSKVEAFDLGDRVFVHHHVACMTCHYCLRGDFTLCEQFHKTNIDPGGLAERFRVPTSNLQIDTLIIPEKLSLEEATFIEPIGCCVRAVEKCKVQKGDSVAVIGAGTTGLIHTALSKIYGASKTIVIDLIDFRLDRAKEFGADITLNPTRQNLTETVNAETEGRGVDLAVVTAPSLEAYKAGMEICRKAGRLCVFAPTDPGRYMQISPKELFFSGIQLIPSYSTSHVETRKALQLMMSGRISVGRLITHRFKLEESAKAFRTALEVKDSLKVVVLNE